MGFLAVYLSGFLLAWVIGASKGRGGAGFLLGFLFSWLGVIIILLVSPTAKAQGRVPCPFCAEMILPQASVCSHCHSTLPAEGWKPDPCGHHAERWWDGHAWTEWARDKPGTRLKDPITS